MSKSVGKLKPSVSFVSRLAAGDGFGRVMQFSQVAEIRDFSATCSVRRESGR
jgi:hypothetical protein